MSLLNAMKRASGAQDDQQGHSRFAVVASVDPARHLVRVAYDEERTLSGWLPVLHALGGAGFSAGSLPPVGAQVFVHADMGAAEHGVVAGIAHSSAQPPGKVTPYHGSGSAQPQDWTPGEWTITTPGGASFRLTGGVIELSGTLKLQGDLLVSGQVRDMDGRRGTLDALRIAYDAHRHTGVRAGGDLSGIPDTLTVDGAGTAGGGA